MNKDIEIAQQTTLEPIHNIAEQLHLTREDWEPYGQTKAKLSEQLFEKLKHKKSGKIILVTSINPTPAGEGKSTVTVGLGQALNQIGKKAIIALREPSLGPVMGLKGGAAGGGYSQVLPMEDINLHFTGDIHAITTANNALAAFIDNHIHRGNTLQIDARRIEWKRVLDINDRALRQTIIGLGGPKQGVPREDGFTITVASEIMAVLCLATDLQDLKQKLAAIVVGYTFDNQPVTVGDLKVEGALTLLLKDAMKPNLVQTTENTPAIIHGGPFANIAHGCNSIIATKTAAKLADYTVTEAGFGADLGAEKYFHIKSRAGNIQTSAVVIVATVRALKMHGGIAKDKLATENIAALEAGMDNLQKHIETIQAFHVPFVVAINQFPTDTEQETTFIQEWCQERGYEVALTTVWADGGKGGIDLAEKIIAKADGFNSTYQPLYDLDEPLTEKMRKVAQKVYGAHDIELTKSAQEQLRFFEEQGWSNLPVCMAKTQYSLSDNPALLGRPTGFTITIRELRASIGAGFIVALTGDVLTMPGLPAKPAALQMDVGEDGKAKGLF
ncbi:formate--tetrahydrofolate ligase [Virgibacillus pantothenticus]|uniref:Formate--tetrahydrofolate ligase n=1 Tax=Virgibacillus pantothenticus TaxID=1473 RepID=A0A0L0QNX4_VIRPA|nr:MULTISPECIES: formate--tetrahydrofolate ligase [Virgibacillus]API94090.1 formate--tetrahydrofolate ligase [Virgibacillus sp. 6R]KNE20330.1 formate--tetrahydrofolate ligase [Virgibacillus pantothenticus]MBS7429464.1 formate--tetrahydrofolate ligase [Virgibacillus sp. 19R1-5]MED3738006.1 formate--tetrahydrofolate ligase [Virgibacillus pantothenticus]QTY17920.1 formate--tetrahydrofolate ligase [Virgibacillus pantothenticus]